MIDLVCAQTGPRKVELVEPVVFDLIGRHSVAEVDIETHPHPVIGNSHRVAQEGPEGPHQSDVRVRDRAAVALLRPFRPVEHAAHEVKRVSAAGFSAPLGLSRRSQLAIPVDPDKPTGIPSRLLVARGVSWAEFDIPGPYVNRPGRDSQLSRDLLHRHPEFRPQAPRLLELLGLIGRFWW